MLHTSLKITLPRAVADQLFSLCLAVLVPLGILGAVSLFVSVVALPLSFVMGWI